ncbi:calcium-dependent phosphotriesterase [Coniophora puteana RWD-64-598 SS2]|uniref:Calcium-dependent phosphotriesterase n=1 Tax=Coniophora puteana (strain RWD-64-598) TaxID=741705 RepID=A0A5M3MVH5_CONPW|nr:calcium-dependent phosphotriesterase [Coniophora puteana RWD-64-598 SS2]EIW83168.1 calcium-dependent phosphotriesterase [Coniophora puteana RWD-64-598 SS2]
MAPVFTTVFVAFIAIVAGLGLHLKPYLQAVGLGKTVTPVGNSKCRTLPELQACEKVVLHEPSGHLWLACSNFEGRKHWTPALDRLDASRRSTDDYVARVDPETNTVTRMKLTSFTEERGLSVHGMDVVPSEIDPTILYVYLVNHRPPIHGDATRIGADSVIEIFETRQGSETLEHVRTVHDPEVIITPNDVMGSSDGKSFFFTNDYGIKAGWRRTLNLLLQLSGGSVGYCHLHTGCKLAARNVHAANGIVKGRGANETVFVGDNVLGDISVFEKQADNSLVLTEVIKTGIAHDNLAIDGNGALWTAGLSDGLGFMLKQFKEPPAKIASSALRVTVNHGVGAFYGEKYKIDKVFEDAGELVSGCTSAVYDSTKGRLYMHGLASPHLTICEL